MPDGREDLSLAAAFEIGRLLALSQPGSSRALMAWRAEQFGAERARQLVSAVSDAAAAIKPALEGAAHDLGALIGRHLVLAAAENPRRPWRRRARWSTPAARCRSPPTAGSSELLAEGFGFSLEEVSKRAAKLGAAGALRATAVAVADADEREPPLDGPAVERLRGGLGDAVDRLTADALKTKTDMAAGARRTRAPARPTRSTI